jgi:hypothetical protein
MPKKSEMSRIVGKSANEILASSAADLARLRVARPTGKLG